MKIADGLELLKSLGREKQRLEKLGEQDSWSYRSQDPNAKWEPNFDIEKNHEEVMRLDKLTRKLSRAINRTNNDVSIIGVNDDDYAEYL